MLINEENYLYMIIPLMIFYYLYNIIQQSVIFLMIQRPIPLWKYYAPKFAFTMTIFFIIISFFILYLLNRDYNNHKIDRKSLSLYFFTCIMMFIAMYIILMEGLALVTL